jgi:hypothetical protein
VHAGWICADSTQLQRIVEVLESREKVRIFGAKGATLLTKREEQIVRMVAKGLPNSEICTALGLSSHNSRIIYLTFTTNSGFQVAPSYNSTLWAVGMPPEVETIHADNQLTEPKSASIRGPGSAVPLIAAFRLMPDGRRTRTSLLIPVDFGCRCFAMAVADCGSWPGRLR